MSADDVFIPNLAPNANGLTPMLVQIVERHAPLGLRGMRLRDTFFRVLESGEVRLGVFLAIGGDNRGGRDSASWNRIRNHPLYVSDADSTIDGHATVEFRVPEHIATQARLLATEVPLTSTSPEDKQRDAIDVKMGRPLPDRMSKLSQNEVRTHIMALACAVESYHPVMGE